MTKKKLVVFLLTGCMLLSLTACETKEDVVTATGTPAPTTEAAPTATPLPTKAPAPTETPVPAAKTVAPLPVTVDMSNLTDCTVAVSFEKEDVSVGTNQLKVTVYTYDLYDMVDISMLAVGDIIILRGEEVLISSLNTTDYGAVQINGGLDEGGYELITNDHTVYFETGYSDVKTYFELGEATLPVSDDFVFIDNTDPEGNEKTFIFEDLSTDKVAYIYEFTPHNTRIVIQSGIVTKMERIYTP